MQKVCRNCCKIFCKERDKVTECNKQITFVKQMIESNNSYNNRIKDEQYKFEEETDARSL